MDEDRMSEDEWYAAYHPVDAPSGGLYWYPREVAFATPRIGDDRIWTAIDIGGGDIEIVPGVHAVNAIGLVVTRCAHGTATRSVRLEDRWGTQRRYGMYGAYIEGGAL